jgi:hypothetical protein
MWKLITVVVLALAAGTFGANAGKKKESITLAEAQKLCRPLTSCGWCVDRKCDTLVEVECKGDKCTKTTTTAIKVSPNKAATTESRIPGGGILDTRTGFGSNSPAATGAAAPSALPGPALR